MPGTEISTVFEGTELHILGLFIPERGWEAARAHGPMRRSKEESNHDSWSAARERRAMP